MKNGWSIATIITTIISWLLCIVPSVVFIAIGFSNASTNEKLTIGIVSVFALTVLAIMLFCKLKIWRCIFSLVFLLLLWIGGEIALAASVVLGCQILDELVCQPLIRFFKKRRDMRQQAIENAKAIKEAN